MGKIWKFNEDYLKEKIEEGEYLLRKTDIDDEIKFEIDSMLSNFYDYLGKNNYSTSERPNLSLEQIYSSLGNKFSRDLAKLNLDIWNKMHDLCWNSEKASFLTSNTHRMHLSDDQVVDRVMKFYKNLDNDFYYGLMKIINNPAGLINFTNNKILGDHCFTCHYLDLPFINVCRENDLMDIWVAHEFQHGIDYVLYRKVPYLFSETSAIFSETLYIDSLVQNGIKGVDTKRFYSYRIHTNNENMKKLYDYIEILYKFIENGLIIDKYNIGKILGCDNEEDVVKKYKYLRLHNYIEIYSYVLGFFKSLELREIYYNDSDVALSQLKRILIGSSDEVDFDILSDSYSNYIREIKKKYKVKSR